MNACSYISEGGLYLFFWVQFVLLMVNATFTSKSFRFLFWPKYECQINFQL